MKTIPFKWVVLGTLCAGAFTLGQMFPQGHKTLPPSHITVVHLGTPQDLENLHKAQWMDLDSVTVTKVESWTGEDTTTSLVELDHTITCLNGITKDPNDLDSLPLIDVGDTLHHVRVQLKDYSFDYGSGITEISSVDCRIISNHTFPKPSTKYPE